MIPLQMMSQAQGQHRDLIQSIEGLPAAPGLSPLDQDLLMLKATSMATMNCLNECLHILHLQQVARQRGSLGGQWMGGWCENCTSECGYCGFLPSLGLFVYLQVILTLLSRR